MIGEKDEDQIMEAKHRRIRSTILDQAPNWKKNNKVRRPRVRKTGAYLSRLEALELRYIEGDEELYLGKNGSPSSNRNLFGWYT